MYVQILYNYSRPLFGLQTTPTKTRIITMGHEWFFLPLQPGGYKIPLNTLREIKLTIGKKKYNTTTVVGVEHVQVFLFTFYLSLSNEVQVLYV